MGTVYRKTFTKPVPTDAETLIRKGERFARWKDAKGKTRTARLTEGKNGSPRLLIKADTYTAKYRNGAGIVVETSTGCRDETAARSVLADLERRAELVKAKVITSAEDTIAQHQKTTLADHFDAYGEHLRAKEVTGKRVKESRYYLERLAAECPFASLADLRREALERWLGKRTAEGMSARNRNAFREVAVAFGNWCCETDRLVSNPFDAIPKANTKADSRRPRRAMTEDELRRLLDVARRRPMLEALTIRRGPRKGELTANVKPHVRERLELLGWERALIYRTLVLSGLRKGELESLTVGQFTLDEARCFATLNAADEKNREGNVIPIRADLAADLRAWLDAKLERLQGEAVRDGGSIPARLPADTPVFSVPHKLYLILGRDLKAAGIPKRDERGRVLDVHALRTTFGTMMSRAGVSPRTAQAAMRHSTIDLTMNVYTDPKLLDIHGALDALPALPLDTCTNPERIAVSLTGTDPIPSTPLAPTLAPTTDFSGHSESFAVIMAALGVVREDEETVAVSSSPVKTKNPLTTPVSGSHDYPQGDSNPCLLAENQTS